MGYRLIGRTTGFEPVNLGSNPNIPAKGKNKMIEIFLTNNFKTYEHCIKISANTLELYNDKIIVDKNKIYKKYCCTFFVGRDDSPKATTWKNDDYIKKYNICPVGKQFFLNEDIFYIKMV